MKIIKATVENLDQLAPLFNEYRVFYKQASSVFATKQFLTQRFQENDSVIFLAIFDNGEGMGFTQLYPSFSSVAMQRTYILNDLFVATHFRKKGVAENLMNRAKEFAIEKNARGLTLETDTDNPAQKLYERLGWVKDTAVFHYTWEVKN
ncbi:MAG: GNAT family N-acetyltransferase [Patiriisocius sp.]|uniref:GNAT family N-acetyltransferase n=1 Tax=Patiriisocius sp. TaxID=2822396 RepID=UPI003EF3FF96